MWWNGTPYVLAIGSRSMWFDTTAGISIGRLPLACRKSRSFRQWPNFDTISSVRVGVADVDQLPGHPERGGHVLERAAQLGQVAAAGRSPRRRA